jgi:hypothetical protein
VEKYLGKTVCALKVVQLSVGVEVEEDQKWLWWLLVVLLKRTKKRDSYFAIAVRQVDSRYDGIVDE